MPTHPKTIDRPFPAVMRQPIQLCLTAYGSIDISPKCSHTSHRLHTHNMRTYVRASHRLHTHIPNILPNSGCPRCPHVAAPAHTDASRSSCSCPSPSTTTRRPHSNHHHRQQGKGSWPPSPIASAGPSLEAATWGRRRASRSGRAPRRY